MKVLKIWDKEHGPNSMDSGEPLRASEKGINMVYGQSCILGRFFLAVLSRSACPLGISGWRQEGQLGGYCGARHYGTKKGMGDTWPRAWCIARVRGRPKGVQCS